MGNNMDRPPDFTSSPTPPPYEAEIVVRYTDSLLRSVALRLLWHRLGLRTVLSMVALYGLVAYDMQRGQAGLSTYVVAVTALVHIVWYAVALATTVFPISWSPPMSADTFRPTLRFSEAAFEYRTAKLTSRLAWDQFRGIRIVKGVWLLMTGETAYITLPAESVTPELREFLFRKMSEVGAGVKAYAWSVWPVSYSWRPSEGEP